MRQRDQGSHILMRDLTLEVDAGRLTDVEATIKVAEFIQKALDCAHVTFWSVSGEQGKRVMRRTAGYDGLLGVAVRSPVDLYESGGDYFNTLVTAGCYVCGDTLNDPKLAKVKDSVLVPFGIHALLSASFGRNGEVWGSICCTHNRSRKWSASEVTALRKCAAEVSMWRARSRDREIAQAERNT